MSTLGEDTDILIRALLSCQALCSNGQRWYTEMKALHLFGECLHEAVDWQPECSVPPAAAPQPHEHKFSRSLVYPLCRWEISRPTSDPQERGYCLFFCSRIAIKVFLSHFMKQEEQGDDSRSPKPHTHSQEAEDLLQDRQGMWELHSSQSLKNVSWAQAVAVGAYVFATLHLQAPQGSSAFPTEVR